MPNRYISQTAAAVERINQLSFSLAQLYCSQPSASTETLKAIQVMTSAFTRWQQQQLANPYPWLKQWSSWAYNSANLYGYCVQRCMGLVPEPVIETRKDDHRFKADEWQDMAFFDVLKQAYLLMSDTILSSIDGDLDNKDQQQLQFYMQQFLDALSPTNFAMTNPQVLDETISSGGRNLVNGMEALLKDLLAGQGQLSISMTDKEAFTVGENVATTPGAVVYQNDMMQLLMYQPTTEKVLSKPLLIVPPWINKFYILDLRPENSFIRWAVEQGHTVFVVSWVNPDEEYAETGFDDYLTRGILAAIDEIENITGADAVNTIGYCLGGTLLACANAYLANKGDKRIASSTYFTSLLDFSEPGEIGVFIDDDNVQALEQKMEETGYLQAHSMATAFGMLRANDLIWPFFINNYLLGKKPAPFDLLYWNSDSTRMPAAMHSFYLRNMYLHNKLAEPNGISLDGVPIDVTKVTTPSYFLAAEVDHITPWTSVYKGSQLLAGPVRFVLGGSGHIAGVINPPAKGKYGYWTDGDYESDSANWKDSAEQHPGSWWNDWHNWCSQFSEEQVPARQLDNVTQLEAAPGSYVCRSGS